MDMLIKVAAAEPIPARGLLLRTCSACAEQIPADATEWDVSGFLLDGEPFSRDTVKCWLNCGCSLLHGAAALDADDTACLESASGLHSVLAFAHAVGSPDGLLNAACSRLSGLKIRLASKFVELPVTDAAGYGFDEWRGDALQLYRFNIATVVPHGEPFTSEQQQMEFAQQVAAQTAALLHIAYTLRLQPLIAAMNRFVMHNTRSPQFLLRPMLGQVFTDAVLKAGMGSGGALSREAFVNSMTSVDLTGAVALFKPIQITGHIQFTATLQRDFGGCSAGEVVDIRVEQEDPLLADEGVEFEVSFKRHGERGRSRACFPARLLLGSRFTNKDMHE